MRTIILTILLVFCLESLVHAVCEPVEYAELNDMTKDEFKDVYCSMERDSMNISINNTNMNNAGVHTQSSVSIKGREDSRKCYELNRKLSRIFHKKYPDEPYPKCGIEVEFN